MTFRSEHVSLERTPLGFEDGLRGFLLRVYLRVAGGLVLSATVAALVAFTPAIRDGVFSMTQGRPVGLTGWGWALLASPLAVMVLASMRGASARHAAGLYWTLAALIGGSLSLLALIYAGADLVATFLVTAAAFAGLSLWGYVTRRDLGALGSFLGVALLGLVLAMLVNLVLRNAMAELVLSGIGVVVFAGLIAADTQQLKRIYAETADPEALPAAADYGALTLYLNFINLFQLLLSFRSSRR